MKQEDFDKTKRIIQMENALKDMTTALVISHNQIIELVGKNRYQILREQVSELKFQLEMYLDKGEFLEN